MLLRCKDVTDYIAKHRETWRQIVKAGASKVEANAKVQANIQESSEEGTRSLCARSHNTHLRPLHDLAKSDQTSSYPNFLR